MMNSNRVLFALTTLILYASPCSAQQNPAGLAKPGSAIIKDAVTLPLPSEVSLSGLLGQRFTVNWRERLLNVDESELLEGFRHRPGKQAWVGEHIGKWLHAASLSYAATDDARLRAKLDRVVVELIKNQEPNGYLGTYTSDKRFVLLPYADWDVWVHKYNLIGLLTYYQYTGNKSALIAARKIGDLLIATFGQGKKSINSAGTYVGMAATSILEPTVLLYRATGDKRYLNFAEYIVSAWDEEGGAGILSSLERFKSVRKVATGKAYEMLSNMSGLCELYRVTGQRRYLNDVLIAWQDIVNHRLYITGSGSSFELWQDDYHFPLGESANICETCVTVSWEQLNIQLLRLTGQARFAEQLERTIYNHLLGAQRASGREWCYYTPLEGNKPFGSSTNCCLSSGPRGVALLSSIAYGVGQDKILVNLYNSSTSCFKLKDVGEVKLTQQTSYPFDGKVSLTVTKVNSSRKFAFFFRIPTWASSIQALVNGRNVSFTHKDGFLTILRVWKSGDVITIRVPISVRSVHGSHELAGKEAVMYGPLVLAADEEHNPSLAPIHSALIDIRNLSSVRFLKPTDSSASLVFGVPGQIQEPSGSSRKVTISFVPFFTAGQDGSKFAVWLTMAGSTKSQ